MSRCKEGEGVYYISPDPFTTGAIEPGLQYHVLVLGDGQLIDDQIARAFTLRERDKAISDGSDMALICHDYGTVELVSRSEMYITYPVNSYDIIIKDLDHRTVAMIPNVTITN